MFRAKEEAVGIAFDVFLILTITLSLINVSEQFGVIYSNPYQLIFINELLPINSEVYITHLCLPCDICV